MIMKAVNDYVFVKPDKEQTKVPDSILLPDSIKKDMITGTVLSIFNHSYIKCGDTVMFERPHQIRSTKDDRFYIIKAKDIIGIVE